MRVFILFILISFTINCLSQTPRVLLQSRHNAPISQIACSHNEQWIASASEDLQIKIWNAQSNKLLCTFSNRGRIAHALAFHPKMNLLLSSCGNKILFWDFKQGKVFDSIDFKYGDIYSMNFSADGKYLVCAGSGEVTVVYDFKKHKVLSILKEEIYYTNTIYVSIFSNSGEYVFTAGEDIYIKMWDWRKKKMVKKFRMHKFKVNDLAINKYDNLLASASNDKTVRVWDITSGNEIMNISQIQQPAQSVVFHPDLPKVLISSYFASIDSSSGEAIANIQGTLSQWDIDNRKMDWKFDQDGGFTHFALLKSQNKLISGDSKNQIKTLGIEKGNLLDQFGAEVGTNEFALIESLNQILVAGENGKIKIWDIRTGTVFKTINSGLMESATAISFNPKTNELIAAFGKWMILYQYDHSKNEFIEQNRLKSDAGKVYKLDFIDNTKYILVARLKRENAMAKGANKLDAYKEGKLPQDLLDYKDTIFLETWDAHIGMKVNHVTSFASAHIPLYLNTEENYLLFPDSTNDILKCDINKGFEETRLIAHHRYDPPVPLSEAKTSILTKFIKIFKKREIPIYQDLRQKDVFALTASSDKRFIAYGGSLPYINLYDSMNLEVTQFGNFKNNISAMKFSPDNSLLAIASGKCISLWDYQNAKQISEFISDGNIQQMIFSSNGSHLYTVGKYDGIKIWDIHHKSLVAHLIYVGDQDFIVFDKNFYYNHSPNGSKGIALVMDDLPIPIEQYSMVLGRSDKILDALGYEDQNIKTMHQNAYNYRLGKYGFALKKFDQIISPPKVEIVDKQDIVRYTEKQDIKLSIHAYDVLYKLDRVNITVNNWPIYGIKGFNLKKQNSDEFHRAFNVFLEPGRNCIEVSCMNEKGVCSTKDSILIQYKGNANKPNLYVFVLATDTFRNMQNEAKLKSEKLNLNGKTAQPISHYNRVIIDSLLNEKLNLKNCLQLFKKYTFERDDEIVLVINGKILIQDDLQLLTYDFNPKSTKNNPLSFDKIFDLLSNSKARKKQIFFDLMPVNISLNTTAKDTALLGVNYKSADGSSNYVEPANPCRDYSLKKLNDPELLSVYNILLNSFTELNVAMGAKVHFASDRDPSLFPQKESNASKDTGKFIDDENSKQSYESNR